MDVAKNEVTKAELTKALDDACRLLACYRSLLQDLGQDSQATAIRRHLDMKCGLVNRVKHEEYLASIRR